jgi:hypothetical protein
MINFKNKIPKVSCLLANPTCLDQHKPGQNQPLKENTCILNVIKALSTTGLLLISEVISCAKS